MTAHVHDERVQAAVAELGSILVPGETIEAMAVQHRLFALIHRRVIVAATSGRLIGLNRGLLGGFHPVDVRWQDLKEAKLKVGIFGARLTINTTGQGTIVYEGLDKQGAQAVYRLCQAHEQSWREKRRVRELEEMRARSGGVHIGQTGAAAEASGGAAREESITRLEKAKAMLEKGLISDAEYETIKAKIISNL